MQISFQKLFYAIATLFALFAILVLGKPVLIPLSMALLLSFILLPVTKKFESWKMSKIIAAFLSIVVVFILIGGVVYFFSTQIINLSIEVSNFKDKIILVFADATLYINNNVGFIENFEKNELFDMIKNWLNKSTGSLVTKSINSTASFLTGLMATVIFTFLILIYRQGLTEALIEFAHKDKRARVLKMFKSVQQVGKKYLLGMLVTTILIGLANSFGLWIIGIDNPFLFGFLGATLSIIPYIGTISGGLIPIIYAFASYNSIWMLIYIGILFWGVQLVADNFFTPKIVGGSLKINALAAILSLIIGAVVWGLVGMILFLPFAAMLKVMCEEYEELKPIALLLGNHNDPENEDGGNFLTRWVEKVRGWHPKFRRKSKKKR